MPAIEQWWERGSIEPVELGGASRSVFVQRLGSGPHLTLLHGYPSSSHDWAKIAPGLATRHELLLPDFLGFGASEKPVDHDYSLQEQADLVEALWARDAVTATVLVGHDYAVSVVQELLARREEGTLTTEISAVQLLNGGLYPHLHRPQPIQLALLDPEQGPKLAELVTEDLVVAGLAPTFGAGFDAGADSRDIWRSMERNGGQRLGHRLIRYIVDREQNAERWTGALERAELPVSFVWGMLDPVSGAHMAEHIAERLPEAPMVTLDDVGHWPQLEAPAVVEAQLA